MYFARADGENVISIRDEAHELRITDSNDGGIDLACIELRSSRTYTRLEMLDVNMTCCTTMNSFLNAINSHTTLTELNLQQQNVDFVAKLLSTNSTLQELNLHRLRLAKPCNVSKLACSIASNTTLLDLSICVRTCTREGALMLSNAMRFNTSLRRLQLYGIGAWYNTDQYIGRTMYDRVKQNVSNTSRDTKRHLLLKWMPMKSLFDK
jgi:hypothetical protein